MPQRSAMSEIAVLSPPGRIRALHWESWSAVRTSRKVKVVLCWDVRDGAAWVRRVMCSMKAPWRARTPMQRCCGVGGGEVMVVVIRGCSCIEAHLIYSSGGVLVTWKLVHAHAKDY